MNTLIDDSSDLLDSKNEVWIWNFLLYTCIHVCIYNYS